jgi:hypothetical protein
MCQDGSNISVPSKSYPLCPHGLTCPHCDICDVPIPYFVNQNSLEPSDA